MICTRIFTLNFQCRSTFLTLIPRSELVKIEIFFEARILTFLYYWSSEGRSFVMRSLIPCPENFDQKVVVCGGGGGGTTNFFFIILASGKKSSKKQFFSLWTVARGRGNYKSSFHKLQIIILVSGTKCSKKNFL